MSTWLIDKSAYARLPRSEQAPVWLNRIDRALVHVATVTRLEIGYSLRGGIELDQEEDGLLGRLIPTPTPPRAEARAIEVQRALTSQGQHRAPSLADLLVVATAEILGHVVLHLDKDFDLLAAVTGQPMERLAPPESGSW